MICERCNIFEIGQSKKKWNFMGTKLTNTFFALDHIAKQTKKHNLLRKKIVHTI